jgi:osmoprotectant transport system permease protein
MSESGFLSQVADWFTEAGRWEGSTGIPIRILEHLTMSFVTVAVAALVALPTGLFIGHKRRFEFAVVSVANFGRAIPSFGLLLLFVSFLGLGLAFPPALRPPILLVLILLAIPPILTNTYVGVQAVEADTLEAARGVGMTEGEVLRQIELPLAAPLIVAGLRTAAVQVVATATLAAVPGGGGLGRFIVDGFATGRDPQIFGGALLVTVLAIVTELGFAFLQRAVAPRTSRRRARPTPAPTPIPGPSA